MKQKDKTQMHTTSSVDLISQIRATNEQITKMNIGRYTKPAKNVHELTILKRKVAIMKTILNQKNQGASV